MGLDPICDVKTSARAACSIDKSENRVVVEEYSAKKLYFIEIKTQRISQDRINFMYNIFIQ